MFRTMPCPHPTGVGTIDPRSGAYPLSLPTAPPKLDPILGLHFRNVLGDALRDERRLARRRSHVA
jgi:hypothetical protein